MSSIFVQRDVAALFYAIIGKKADIKDIDYFSKKLTQENLSLSVLANKLINSELGQSRLSELNEREQVQFIYHNIHGTYASEKTLTYLLSLLERRGDLGSLAAYMSNDLLHYSGQESLLQEQQTALIETVNQTLFPSFNSSVSDGAEWVQGFYYAVKSTMTSDGINYWGNVINSHPEQLNLIAQKFVEGKKTLSNLSDNDFVIKIYENIFGSAPDNDQLQKYITELNINTESRGDVIVRMINDIRNDETSVHADAKAIFLANTHVYAAGELPAPKYQEAITAIYLSIAGYYIDANALDTYSKQLAAGRSESDILAMFSKQPAFAKASSYQIIFNNLWGRPMTTAESVAIMNESGNDALKATLAVLAHFRANESIIAGNGGAPGSYAVQQFEQKIGANLNYVKQGILTKSGENGELTGIINNHGVEHIISNAELSMLNDITLNVVKSGTIDISQFNGWHTLTIDGTESVLLKLFAQALNNINIFLKNPNVTLVSPITGNNQNIIITADADMAHATGVLRFNFAKNINVQWQGNSINDGANSVSDTFKIKGYDQGSVLAANLITKNVYLTTGVDGALSGTIATNVGNFTLFPQIDLAGYRGTGSIYVDGQLVGNEGRHVFDIGLLADPSIANIHNKDYTHVTDLKAPELWDPAWGMPNGFTGSYGFALSGFADNVTVINVPVDSFMDAPFSQRALEITGNAGENSHITFEYAPDYRYKNFSPVMTITFDAKNITHADAGTLSFKTDTVYIDSDIPEVREFLEISSKGDAENTLRLEGHDNHISEINITGDKALNLTIKNNFSEELKSITSHMANSAPLNLTLEQGGTGGGLFYQVLKQLGGLTGYAAIMSQMAGYQLSIANDAPTTNGIQANHLYNVMGNTSLATGQGADTVVFSHSTIDNMVTFNDYENSSAQNASWVEGDNIVVGDVDRQWLFSAGGSKTIDLVGSLSLNDLTVLLSGMNVQTNTTPQQLFIELVSKVTQGHSQGTLSEVSALSLNGSYFVIVDKNLNHSLDNDDIIFGLTSDNAFKMAHYDSPVLEVNGIGSFTHDAVAA
ncbi:DUF4214 domain-containing protein [Serratia marcescens]|uniref:DUF4214 domain-containing protein n=1 Tax=Serratia marcescens TaxID=615 RepID=UPI003EE30ABE